MDCRDAQDELLRSDALCADDLPPGVLSNHVAGCCACRERLSDLSQLERAWRAISLPASSERAPDSLLIRFSSEAIRPRRQRRPALRWLIAASVLLILGVGVGLLVRSPREASADVVERLVDWNLNLARASTHADRDRLYENQASALKAEVLNARLPAGDRDLAESLLETAPWFACNDDPLAEADRFNDMADQLLTRMNLASSGGDHDRVEQYARLFRRVRELGIESKLDILEASGALDFDRQRRLERLVLRDADRMLSLVALLERAPDSTRKEIKRVLKPTRQRPRKERRAVEKGSNPTAALAPPDAP